MSKKEQAFQSFIQGWYKKYGRHNLPWRHTHDPYLILVSELMLQQTQVERVIPKYLAFTKTWPTAKALSKASLADVLIAWQGLGYNRRAKFLHQCAITITKEYGGEFPVTRQELEKLPGIGPYTAGAFMAFAFNQPVVLIETNVRRVYLHHFFPTKDQVLDTEIFPYLKRTLPKDNSRDWYSALMDYGTYLKKNGPNPNQRSAHYQKQSAFKGSDREIRGAILKVLAGSPVKKKQLYTTLGQFEIERVSTQAGSLLAEGLIEYRNTTYQLKS